MAITDSISDEYPTHEQLQAIRDFKGTPEQMVELINGMWWHEGFSVRDGTNRMDDLVKKLEISTWGWSGNEDIIGTLRDTWFWMHLWESSLRGGHYEFHVKPDWWQREGLPMGALPGREIEPSDELPD